MVSRSWRSPLTNIVQLFEGDPRMGELAAEIMDVLHKQRPYKIPLPSALGVLDIVKATLLKEAQG